MYYSVPLAPPFPQYFGAWGLFIFTNGAHKSQAVFATIQFEIFVSSS